MRPRGVDFARRRGWCQNARRGGDRYGHRPLCSEKKVLAPAYFPTSYPAVSSAMEGLTSEFGMGSGVPPPPWTPGQILWSPSGKAGYAYAATSYGTEIESNRVERNFMKKTRRSGY